MAVYVSAASGNWTTMSTWQTVDATSYSNSISQLAYIPLSTGGSPDVGRGQPFTPGAITIDAIGLLMGTRPSTSTSGTITVNLYNVTDNADVAGTSVTINVTDVQVISSNRIDGGWYIFKFSAPVTLTAGKSYTVVLTTTNTDNAITAWTIGDFLGNWSRLLRTTTNPGSLSAGDDFIVAGEFTGAGTSNSYTVTMDNTSTTDFGNNLGDPYKSGLSICNKGTLSYGTAGSTNYYLKISNFVVVYNGGTFNIGTTGAPIPGSSTAVLEFDSIGADATSGLLVQCGATWVVQGSPRTAGKLVTWCLLTADAAAGATSLTVNQDTGWLDGDEIVVADTGNAYSAARNEKGSLNGNAGASALTVRGFSGSPDAGLVYDHLGTAPIHQAEVINLTRNVKIRSASSTEMADILLKVGCTVDMDWAEIYYCGSSAGGTHGCLSIYYSTDTAASYNISVRYCSLHHSEYGGIISGLLSEGGVPGTTTLYEIRNCVFYSIPNYSIYYFLPTGAYIDDVVSIGSFNAVSLGATRDGTTISNVRAITTDFGFYFGTDGNTISHSVSNLVCHSSNGNMSINSRDYNNYYNLTVWRNGGGAGSVFNSDSPVDGFTAVQISSYGANFNRCQCRIRNFRTNTDTIGPDSGGMAAFSAGTVVTLENAIFGTPSGMLTTNTGGYHISVRGQPSWPILNNCTFADNGLPNIEWYYQSPYANVFFQKFNKVAGDHRTNSTAMPSTGGITYVYGEVRTDAVIFRSASPSVRMTPKRTAFKLETAPSRKGWLVPVQKNGTVTASVWVRKSTAGDLGSYSPDLVGASPDLITYNGAAPRLVLRSNAAIGITSDTVIATMSTSPDLSGVWTLVSGTTAAATDDGMMEFYVDCDGTAGWINVDDFSGLSYEGPGDIGP